LKWRIQIWAYRIELKTNPELQTQEENKINLLTIYLVSQNSDYLRIHLQKEFYINPEDKEEIYKRLLETYFKKLGYSMKQRKEPDKILDAINELRNLQRNLFKEIPKIKSDNVEIIEHFLKQKSPEALETGGNKDHKPSDVKNSIKKAGTGWEIIYNGERKLLKDLRGIYYFSKCLKASHTKFNYNVLLEVHDIDNLPLNSEFYEIKKNLKKVQDEILRFKNDFDSDPTYYQIEIEKLEVEEEKLIDQIAQIRLKSDNYTGLDKKISSTFTKACRKAMSHCQEHFPEFYEHINNYIKWENGKISYSGDIDWLWLFNIIFYKRLAKSLNDS